MRMKFLNDGKSSATNSDYILKRSFLSSSLNPISVGASCSSFIVFLHQQRNYNTRSSSSIFRRHFCCVSKLIKFALRARCCPGNVSQFAQHGNNIHFVSRAFARPRNIMSNNVSPTMCPRLPGPLSNIICITQITCKFLNNAMLPYNTRLNFFRLSVEHFSDMILRTCVRNSKHN